MGIGRSNTIFGNPPGEVDGLITFKRVISKYIFVTITQAIPAILIVIQKIFAFKAKIDGVRCHYGRFIGNI
jgi:hypothetical protein